VLYAIFGMVLSATFHYCTGLHFHDET